MAAGFLCVLCYEGDGLCNGRAVRLAVYRLRLFRWFCCFRFCGEVVDDLVG